MATNKEVAELRTQGVINAAQDPESQVTADDAQKAMVEESKNAGIPAFSFDPDASPEEKRAQARAAIPEGLPTRPGGLSVVTDKDDGAPVADLPSPTKAGVMEAAKDKDGKVIEGQDPEDHEIPFSKTGWAPRFGWPSDDEDATNMLDHATLLESKLPDTLYGDWYHNAAIIVFACLASWLVAVFGGGLGWVFIVMAFCSTYYRTSIRRVRRNFRDDIKREMSLKKLDTDNESLEWINSFLVKFWPIYAPVLCETVIKSVDQVLSSATPAFLDSLKLKTFTLGSKPPRMEHVKTYPRAEDDIVIMDWKFSFCPNDTADMTARQLANKYNPKVVLEIRIGKAMISKGLDVIVEDMAFSGTMRLKIKLQIPFPHVEKIEMCFLGDPKIDYVCKPLGGETFGFDINFIPGLEKFILDQIHGNLRPMMYAPNVFPIEVAKMLAGSPVDQAIGVMAVTLHGAHGLKNTDNFAGTVDPYAVITLNRRTELARTKTIKDTANPRWNETHYILVSSYNDSLDIKVFDFNEFRKHKELGVASFQLEQLEELTEHENQRIDVVSNGNSRGVLSCDIRFFPVLEAAENEPAPESNQGIVRFTVEQAKELDGSKSLVGSLSPYAILHLNGRDVHHTDKRNRTNNPVWSAPSKEMLITDRKHARLGVTIMDDRDLVGDQVMGKYQIKLDDLLDCTAEGKDWFHLSGAQTGRVKMMAQWRPVNISGVMAGTGGYITPIGVMRFHFQKATDLRNFEAMGKSDPYVRVLLTGIEKARTVTFKNDLNPTWDEVLYVPVHSNREKLTLEVMDAEKVGKDRSLGLVEVHAADFIKQDEDHEYMPHDEKVVREEGLKLHGKGMPKGVLTYTVSFYPCLNVADPDDDEDEKSEDAKSVKSHLTADDGSTATAPTSPKTPKTPMSPVSQTLKKKKSAQKLEGPKKIRLTPQELLKHESGLLIFRLMEAELQKSNCQIEVYVDDMAFPSYTSSIARNKQHKFEEIGDCIIREIDFSRLTLKVREKGEKVGDGEKDKTVGRLSGNTLDTLKQCLNNPTVLKLKDDDGHISSIKISLKYIPIRMQLDASESRNNMGTVRVDVLDAENLEAADSNGKSDPFCTFELNGQEVFKTKTIKKTLNPQWNEFFEVSVPSRTAAKFRVNVFDWDMTSGDDPLGGADIDLSDLEPFQRAEKRLLLDGKSGSVRLRLLFKPDYVTRQRQGTSTFAGTFGPGRIVTGVAGAPVKAVGTLGAGVGKGASFLKRGFKKDKENDPNGSTPSIPEINTNGDGPPGGGLRRATGLDNEPAGPPPGPAKNGAAAHHSRVKSFGQQSVHSTMTTAGAQAGMATFTVVSTKGFPPSSDVYVVISQTAPKNKTVGKTRHAASPDGVVRFDQTFRFACSPDATFLVAVREHHRFRDEDLGETAYYVDDSSSGPPAEKELKIKNGIVVIKSSFQPSDAAASGSPATDRPTTAGGPGGREGSLLAPDSPKPSSFRRSLLSKREARGSREVTPQQE